MSIQLNKPKPLALAITSALAMTSLLSHYLSYINHIYLKINRLGKPRALAFCFPVGRINREKGIFVETVMTVFRKIPKQ